MKTYSIDRIIPPYAVCESDDRTIMNIPLEQLPVNAQSGDVIVFDGVQYMIDSEETQRRRQATIDLQNKLFK